MLLLVEEDFMAEGTTNDLPMEKALKYTFKL